MIFSLFSFVTALFLYLKNKHPNKNLVIFIALFLSFVTLNLIHEVSDYFTGDGITDGTLYYVWYGLAEAGFLEYKHLISILSISIVLCIIFLRSLFLNTHNNNQTSNTYLPHLLIILALILSPIKSDLYSVLSPLIGKGFHPSNTSYNFYDYYRNPTIQQIKEKKNLVFIYAESLEQSYSDEDNFPGLTPGLNKLSKRAISFSNLQQIKGSGFTMGGMIASQCGISLIGIPYGNSMSGMDAFLPGAICLGDLLNREGYYLSYFGGANSEFAGKDIFYKTHHFNDIIGSKELSMNLSDPTYKTNWGIYDDTLLNVTYESFLALSKEQSNFAIFLLTIDTHQPKERPSKECDAMKYKDGRDITLNAVHCSDYLITKFVDKILDSQFAKNTTIIIASDHLAPYNPVKYATGDRSRGNRLMIISPEITKPITTRKLGSTLDIGPTILPFIGLNGNIGLGRNLLNKHQSDFEIQIIQQQIPEWETQFMSFWSFPNIKDGITINPDEGYVIIGDRKFKTPILIELDKKLQTTLRFEFDLEFDTSDKRDQRDLISQVKALQKEKAFLLINTCENIQKIQPHQNKNIFCLVSKKDGAYSIAGIDRQQVLTLQMIKTLTGI